jgi:hypothetical protein
MIVTSTRVVHDGVKNLALVLTGQADSQGGSEIKAVKLDVSETNSPTAVPKTTRITYDVYGGSVSLFWEDANDDAPLATLSGQGELCFDHIGGLTNGAADPSGDILLSTRDFLPGSSYTISLEMRK